MECKKITSFLTLVRDGMYEALNYKESKHHTGNYSFQAVKTVCSVNNGLKTLDSSLEQSCYRRA